MREKELGRKKQETTKRKRIQHKISRKKTQEARKQWSKQHGGDTYGSEPKEKPAKRCKACGANTHSRTTSKDCPYNKRNRPVPVQPFDDGDEQPLPEENFQLSDATSSDDPPSTDDTSSDNSSIMEDLIFMCACDRRAHKADCPLNSKNRYTKRELFPRVTPDQGKTLQLGEYCALHRACMANKHLICRVTQVFKKHYRLYCTSGILSENFSSSDMTTCPKKDDIPLDKWRQSCLISVRDIPNKDLDECLCVLQLNTTGYIYVGDDNEPDLEQPDVWVPNPLYTLTNEDHETIRQPTGWLGDSVIAAMLLQEYPNIAGFEPPPLQEVDSH